MDTLKEIESSLDKTLVADELINITSELTEVGLDSLLNDGLLKDLPIVGFFFGLTKVGIGIHEKLFLKKMLRFLFHLKAIPKEDRQNFIKKLSSDKKYKTKVGEALILIVDKLNDYTKADYLGKLFAYTITGRVDFETFLKLSNIIDRSFVQDLNYLLPFYNGEADKIDETDRDILYNLGLLKNLGVDGGTFLFLRNEDAPNKKVQMEINKYGKLIVELLLSQENNNS
jgi:hypothetical protein